MSLNSSCHAVDAGPIIPTPAAGPSAARPSQTFAPAEWPMTVSVTFDNGFRLEGSFTIRLF
jgi:hypothetical protein